MNGLANRVLLRSEGGGLIKSVRPMERVPRVSVVIPCHNYGRYLRQCVTSVTENQDGVDVEVIIIDDCSSDDSRKVAGDIAADDARVRVILNEKNLGHIATYNKALAQVTGEFVILLSADDLAAPGALPRAAALLMAESRVGLVYGHVVDFAGTPPPAANRDPKWIVWPGVSWLRGRCKAGYNVVSTPGVVMRTSVLRAIGGYRPDIPHAGDFEMWLRASAHAEVGFVAGVTQGYYRLHDTNMHKAVFKSGTAAGFFIDLRQRWQCFEAVFSGIGRQLAEGDDLFEIARKTIASQALGIASYAYARGFRDFPIDELEAFAYEVYPAVRHMAAGRAFARRKRLGMLSLPLHPLWALSAIAWRLEGPMRRLRRGLVGV